MAKFAKIKYQGNIHWILIHSDSNGTVLKNSPFDNKISISSETVDITDNSIEFLPVSEPTTVVGLGWNYKDLVGERNRYEEPIIFLKSTHSVCGHNSTIHLSELHDKVWVEVELVIIISKRTKDVNVESAPAHILGFTIGSDITAENILNRDWHLARSKAYENYAPIGPYLVTRIAHEDLYMKSFINGKNYQNSTTKNMIFNINEIVSFVSKHIVLDKGDLIFTGSPAGARDSIIKPKDRVDHIIEDIGTLSFYIA